MQWSAKDILIPLKLVALETRMDLVLSSPKGTDSLLSLKNWHDEEKSFINSLFQFFEHPHIGRKHKCHLHTNRSQLLIKIGEDYLHIREKGAVQEWSLLVPTSEKKIQYKPKLSISEIRRLKPFLNASVFPYQRKRNISTYSKKGD